MSITVRSNEKPEAQATPTSPTPVEEKGTPASGSLLETAQPSAPESSEKDLGQKKEADSETLSDDPAIKDEESEEGEEKESQEETPHEKPKKKSGFQRRIDKLNAAKSQAQQEAEYWKSQALNNASQPSKQSPEKSTIPAFTDPNQAPKPKPEAFDSHTDYVEALTDWKTEQKFKEQARKVEEQRSQKEQGERLKSHAERVQAFSAKKEDWEDLISNLDDVPRSAAIESIIVSSQLGPELLYELAKDPKEARRIAMLPAISAAVEMGKLQARLESKAGPSESKKTITHAPKPLTPVSAAGNGSAKKSIYDSGLSQADYERLRMEQIKKRR